MATSTKDEIKTLEYSTLKVSLSHILTASTVDYPHTRTHARTHACTHARTHTHTQHTHTHTHLLTHLLTMHTCMIITYTHTHTHTPHTHTHKPTNMYHTCILTWTRVCVSRHTYLNMRDNLYYLLQSF